MNDSVRAAVAKSLGFDPSDPQWDAISAPLDSASIVAGAGSGKTAVMSARVLWAVLTGQLRPDQILGMTFTNKAAGELQVRIRELLDTADGNMISATIPGEVAVSTYHSFAASIITEHGIRSGIEPGSKVLVDIDRFQLAARIVATTEVDLMGIDLTPDTVVERLLNLDDSLAELDISTEAFRLDARKLIGQLQAVEPLQKIGREMLTTAEHRVLYADLVDEFRQAKQARNVVDFADQLRLSLLLVRQFPTITEQMRDTYRLVLLDEYQDTSIAQRLLLQALFADGHPVTAVGDPCQAIYEWRGASVDNIDQFGQHFPCVSASGKVERAGVFPLADNRRSAPAILNLANELAQPLRQIHTSVHELTPAAEGKGPGHIRVGLWETIDDEIAWVAEEIKSFGRSDAGDQSEPPAWSDVLVLARKADHLRLLDKALRDLGVPTRLVSKGGLLGHPLVQEILAYFRVITDATANSAFAHIATGPRWRISLRDMTVLGLIARDLSSSTDRRDLKQVPLDQRLVASIQGRDPSERVSLSDACLFAAGRYPTSAAAVDSDLIARLSTDAMARLRGLADDLESLRSHRGDGPRELMYRVLARTGLGAEALVGDAATVTDNSRALQAFAQFAGQFSDLDGRVSVTAFLAYVRDAQAHAIGPELSTASAESVVRLMTVHGAKGLEAPHVFVIGMSKGDFPSGTMRPLWPKAAQVVPWRLRPDAPRDLLEFPLLDTDPTQTPKAQEHDAFKEVSRRYELIEERRLLYVAITRGQRSVTVTGYGWPPPPKPYRGPSEFMTEIREWCLSHGGEVVCWAEPPRDDDPHPLLAVQQAGVSWTHESPAQQRAWAAGAKVRAAMAEASEVGPVALSDEAQRLVDHARQNIFAPVADLPAQVSVTELNRYDNDPAATLAHIDRPMPSAPNMAAHRGSLIHAWIEQHYRSHRLFDIDEVPGAADADLDAELDLDRLRAAFLATEFAHLAPIAVEEPFVLMWQGRQIKGRIDAVFRRGGRDVVVDWKTGRAHSADPAQLEVYRRAWASITGVELDQVDAQFVYL